MDNATAGITDLPIELLVEIGKFNSYEDILAQEKALQVKLVNKFTNVNCDKKYTFDTAPLINISDLNSAIESISDSLLVNITSPEDFIDLIKYKRLIHANFKLPDNKYESVDEFSKYLTTFFEFIFARDPKETGVMYKELVFRVLFKSKYNNELGIVMYKGIINLVNAHNWIGINNAIYDSGRNYILKCLHSSREKYHRDLKLLYSATGHSGTPGINEQVESDTFLYNDDLLGKGIIPILIHNFNKENTWIVDNLNTIGGLIDGTSSSWTFALDFNKGDYLAVNIYYRGQDNKMFDDIEYSFQGQIKDLLEQLTGNEVLNIDIYDTVYNIVDNNSPYKEKLYTLLDCQFEIFKEIYCMDPTNKLDTSGHFTKTRVKHDAYYRTIDDYEVIKNNFEYMYSTVFDNAGNDDK